MRIVLMLSLCFLCGCVSKLCDSKDPIDEVGKKINPKCLECMKDKPVGYSESRANTILPILKTMDSLKKTKDGFVYIQQNEMLLGIIANMSEISTYDKDGKLKELKYFSGKFMYGAIMNITKGVAENFSYNESNLLGGLLGYKKDYINSSQQIVQTDFGVFFNAFGFYSDGEDSYINYLWFPIKY